MRTSKPRQTIALNRHHCSCRRIKGRVIHFLCGRLIFLVRAGRLLPVVKHTMPQYMYIDRFTHDPKLHGSSRTETTFIAAGARRLEQLNLIELRRSDTMRYAGERVITMKTDECRWINVNRDVNDR